MIIVKLIGGLGNQMFQYAAAYALAKKSGQELKLDTLYYNDHSKRRFRFTYRPYALSLFDISAAIATPKEIGRFTQPRTYNKYIYHILRRIHGERNVWREEDVKAYWKGEREIPAEGVYLDGFFQHFKNFESVVDELRHEFTFKENATDAADELGINTCRTPICVVFRRGDYVGHPTLDIVNVEYYYKALEKMPDDGEVFVFSDDIPWCMDNFHPKGRKTHFVDQKYTGLMGGPYMQLMMRCKHFIIPNSTYPYWAALLASNKDKVVVAPKVWYKGQDKSLVNSILPEDWVAIDIPEQA